MSPDRPAAEPTLRRGPPDSTDRVRALHSRPQEGTDPPPGTARTSEPSPDFLCFPGDAIAIQRALPHVRALSYGRRVTTSAPAAALSDWPEPAMPCPPLTPDVVRHGEVFTRRWVVESILDWVGYTSEEDLTRRRLIEPACGQGAFLVVIAQRLSRSCRRNGRDIVDAADAILAYDLLAEHVATSRGKVRDVLTADGWPIESAEELAKRWVRQGDFLIDGPKRPSQITSSGIRHTCAWRKCRQRGQAGIGRPARRWSAGRTFMSASTRSDSGL